MRRTPRRFLVPLVVVGAAMLVLGGVAGALTSAANHRSAEQAAPGILAALQLPPGATAAAADPSAGGRLAEPAAWQATPNLVDVHRYWVVPGDPQAVLDWFKQHPPQGSQANTSGQGGNSHGVTTSWEGFGFGPATPSLSDRELLVTVARAEGGGTAVRADAQVVWVTPRPVWERVPGGVKLVTITVWALGKPPSNRLTVGGAKVKQIVRLTNALDAAQPGAMSCPADFGRYVQLDFSRSSTGSPLATVIADGSGCGLVSFRLGTRAGPSLTGGPEFIELLQLLLHTSLGL